MSIMTWKAAFSDEWAPKILADCPDSDEVAAIIALVEETLIPITREGYRIACNGSCCKAPQGINWTVGIEFESVEMAATVAEAMTRSFGPPEVTTIAAIAGGPAIAP